MPDMRKLGLEVVNFNIQNFKDGAGTIENMGIDNVEQIRKYAQIAKANAQRDIAIAAANAEQEANAVKVQADKLITAQNTELAVQRAEMKVKSDVKKAEAQKKMGEASILEMYLAALPEVVKNAAEPLAQTDKIVMYGDGNSTRMVRDVMGSANQIMEGMKESTGIDMQALLTGFLGASMNQNNA